MLIDKMMSQFFARVPSSLSRRVSSLKGLRHAHTQWRLLGRTTINGFQAPNAASASPTSTTRHFFSTDSAETTNNGQNSSSSPDTRLSSDVKKLGAMLGNAIAASDRTAFETVERLRYLGREWRADQHNREFGCNFCIPPQLCLQKKANV